MPWQMINIDGVAIELRPRPFFQKALILLLSPGNEFRSSNPALPPSPQKTHSSLAFRSRFAECQDSREVSCRNDYSVADETNRRFRVLCTVLVCEGAGPSDKNGFQRESDTVSSRRINDATCDFGSAAAGGCVHGRRTIRTGGWRGSALRLGSF